MSQDAPFDRQLRRLRRDRAASRFGEADYLHRLAADELIERLDFVKRDSRRALDLGCAGGYLTQRLLQRGLDVTPCDAGGAFARGGRVQPTRTACPRRRAFDLVVRSARSTPQRPSGRAVCWPPGAPAGRALLALRGDGSLKRCGGRCWRRRRGGRAAARVHRDRCPSGRRPADPRRIHVPVVDASPSTCAWLADGPRSRPQGGWSDQLLAARSRRPLGRQRPGRRHRRFETPGDKTRSRSRSSTARPEPLSPTAEAGEARQPGRCRWPRPLKPRS